MDLDAIFTASPSDRQSFLDFAEKHELKLCNCAECGKELVALSPEVVSTKFVADRAGFEILYVAGRVKGRPFCYRCLNVKIPPP